VKLRNRGRNITAVHKEFSLYTSYEEWEQANNKNINSADSKRKTW